MSKEDLDEAKKLYEELTVESIQALQSQVKGIGQELEAQYRGTSGKIELKKIKDIENRITNIEEEIKDLKPFDNRADIEQAKKDFLKTVNTLIREHEKLETKLFGEESPSGEFDKLGEIQEINIDIQRIDKKIESINWDVEHRTCNALLSHMNEKGRPDEHGLGVIKSELKKYEALTRWLFVHLHWIATYIKYPEGEWEEIFKYYYPISGAMGWNVDQKTPKDYLDPILGGEKPLREAHGGCAGFSKLNGRIKNGSISPECIHEDLIFSISRDTCRIRYCAKCGHIIDFAPITNADIIDMVDMFNQAITHILLTYTQSVGSVLKEQRTNIVKDLQHLLVGCLEYTPRAKEIKRLIKKWSENENI